MAHVARKPHSAREFLSWVQAQVSRGHNTDHGNAIVPVHQGDHMVATLKTGTLETYRSWLLLLMFLVCLENGASN